MTDDKYNTRLEEVKEKLERREAWQGWILDNDISWDWFATLTFYDIRDDGHTFYRSIHSAKRYFYKWLRQLNRELFGYQAKHQDLSIPWVLGTELQMRGVIHNHALLGYTDRLMRKEWGKKWWKLTNGYGKILPARVKGAVHYITKYILNDGEIDIDLRNETGQHLTLDDPVGYTKAEEGREPTGFLPSEAS